MLWVGSLHTARYASVHFGSLIMCLDLVATRQPAWAHAASCVSAKLFPLGGQGISKTVDGFEHK